MHNRCLVFGKASINCLIYLSLFLLFALLSTQDQFQRDFYLTRQAEYQTYVGQLGPGMVQQGDLTDPFYFDFISFAQYMTINREIAVDPPMIFEEQQPVDQGEDQPMKFVPVIVKRDPSITNDKLGVVHTNKVGSAILDKFDELYGNTDIALPKFDPNGRRLDPGKLCFSRDY